MKKIFIASFLVLSLAFISAMAIYANRTPAIEVEVETDVRMVIATSYFSSFAIQSDGSLWAWGSNRHGILGDGTTKERRHTPVKILDDVVSVSAISNRAMAIKSDGSLWAWGTKTTGIIEYGTYSGTIIRRQYRPVKVMEDVIAVSAGRTHTMAVKADNSLWAWGSNRGGLLGDGTIVTNLRLLK